MPIEPAAAIEQHLRCLYGDRADQLVPAVIEIANRFSQPVPPRQASPSDRRWSERDIALITYGDQVSRPGEPTLEVLREFLMDYELDQAFSIVHILPFCPFSSDDGFSVIDFRAVDKPLGDWSNLRQLGECVDLMYDLVLNHVSQHSRWFQGFLRGESEFANYFHVVDPSLDLSQVTRPRSHPLLTSFQTANGQKHIWTTFSDDQIDLNYAEPQVLLEMLDTLLTYVANGGRVIRLDAIAFLWKEIGTTCLHLEQTHAVVKLCRAVLDQVARDVILLTRDQCPARREY